MTISFASIELEGEATPDVVVHAFYVPEVDGLNAELVRDGSLGIEGRFSSSERARLHNVFNRVLPPERHLPIVRVDNPADKRFEGLMITQLVLEDGWVGLAVGPTADARVAERSRSLASPYSSRVSPKLEIAFRRNASTVGRRFFAACAPTSFVLVAGWCRCGRFFAAVSSALAVSQSSLPSLAGQPRACQIS